jgi:hypothetical protein
MKPKHFEREVRRARHLSARIKAAGRPHSECRVLDISTHGAKIVVTPAVPDHFELAFSQGAPIEPGLFLAVIVNDARLFAQVVGLERRTARKPLRRHHKD